MARGQGSRWMAGGGGIVALLTMAASTVAGADDTARVEPRWRDTGRFYFYVQSGQDFVLDEDFPGDVELDTPDGINVLLGGGFGYNATDHWGVELQFQGTEPDLRSRSLGKVFEYSNVTVMPAVRWRWPMGDEGRLVPWATAGIGASFNDVNDTSNASVRLTTDELTVAGSLAAGLDYLLAEDVAVGIGIHSFFYPDQNTEYTIVHPNGREDHHTGSVNYTSIAFLAHLRVFLGEAAAPGESKPRRLFLAEHGPFDSDDLRAYAVGLFGYASFFDDQFGDGVRQTDSNLDATVGGALGINFDRHWGAEVQLLVTDRDLTQAPFGKLGELSLFTVVPTLRFRYPFLGGRLVPFCTAGVGVGFATPNDRKPYFEQGAPRPTPHVASGGPGVVGSVGIGVEYYLNRHLSVGLAVPVQFGPGIDTTVTNPGARPVHGHLDGANVGGTLRITAYAP